MGAFITPSMVAPGRVKSGAALPTFGPTSGCAAGTWAWAMVTDVTSADARTVAFRCSMELPRFGGERLYRRLRAAVVHTTLNIPWKPDGASQWHPTSIQNRKIPSRSRCHRGLASPRRRLTGQNLAQAREKK